MRPGPICTVLEDFYKMGPGPSSSHTMAPMRMGLDFHRRLGALPRERLARATGVRLHLYGSLSATGRGHGTDRATLAGVLGQAPASCDPDFLDDLALRPERVHRLDLGATRLPVRIADVVFEDPGLAVPHPNTMRARLVAGDEVLFEHEYYSVGGGFVEWPGFEPPARGCPPHPYRTMGELRRYVLEEGLPLVRVLLENEMALSGRTEAEVWAFLEEVARVMIRGVDRGLEAEGLLPGPLGLYSKAAVVYRNSEASSHYVADRAITAVAAFALAMSEENARGHVVVTAPTAGSAGVVPAALKALRDRAGRPMELLREGLLVAAAIGYLCKHNATLSGAEGGCQAEIGVASAMAAALLAHVQGGSFSALEASAESALEHHLGLTCDPVGGYVQVPCIERCAFGVVKAWTAWCLACEEIPGRRKVDFDTCVQAMALTARDMSQKYKETSQGGLAAALVLC